MSASIFKIDGIEYLPEFLASTESNELFSVLQSNLSWSEENIKMFGKTVKVPRLICWYGDNNVTYRYSGVDHFSLPWTPELIEIKQSIEQHIGQRFNSVLGNYYRNENDSMGWHSDNEKELGNNPCIASISLGEERLFKIRHRKSREAHEGLLTNGSLLVMSGNFQNEWQHSIPKARTEKKARINLTYRFVFPR